jgi:hypothetical protein
VVTGVDSEIDEIDEDPPQVPRTWMDGCYAVKWGKWEWGPTVLAAAQQWGDSHCCRLLLTAEDQSGYYTTYLYIAPKPNSLNTGLCKHSINNRDRNIDAFGPWLEGYLAGAGLIKPGDRL